MSEKVKLVGLLAGCITLRLVVEWLRCRSSPR